jgi:hypothetical protein
VLRLIDQFEINLVEVHLIESILPEDNLEEFTWTISIKNDNTYAIKSSRWGLSDDGSSEYDIIM